MKNIGDIKYIDVHSHPHFKDFDEDRNELFENMKSLGVATIAVGTDLKTSKEVVELSEKYDFVWSSIGQHPTEHEEFSAYEFSEIIETDLKNKNRKVVAIGECGLDYFRINKEDDAEKQRQKELFEEQIKLAIKYNLPLMLHIRSSQNTDDAHQDAFEILKFYKNKNSNLHLHMHFFTADIDTARKFIELDASFGVPGVVTFASSVRKMVKELPLERILLESDAPYAAPVPHRGKRNEPVFVIDTLKKIANIKKTPFEKAREQILQNSIKIFNLF